MEMLHHLAENSMLFCRVENAKTTDSILCREEICVNRLEMRCTENGEYGDNSAHNRSNTLREVG